MDSKVFRVLCSALLAFAFVAVAGCGDDEGCPEGQVMCGNECVNWLTNDDHCGQCDNACGLHANCVNGQCSCVAGYSDCSGQCVNLNFDAANCGSCGHACAAGQACVNGSCASGCPQGQEMCGTTCVDVNSNEAHCGDCNNACRNDQVCTNGSCACFGGEQECNGACVDYNTDPDNCGGCGDACGTGELCDNGTCTGGGCGAGQIACGGGCINPDTSNSYCGASDPCADNPGDVCDVANGFTCQDGSCECFVGEECVTGVCTDTNTDEANCGTCGNACRSDQYCNNGACACASGLDNCGDPVNACVDFDTDEANCGACENACRTDQVCVGGSCACPTGKEECGTPAVCVDTQTSHDHCGTCDNDCGSMVCVGGSCVPTGCNPPNEMCGTDCVNTQTSNDHCGTCDNACSVADGFICQSGACECLPGMTACSGVCVNTSSDNNNCGTCGNDCTGGQYCSSGTCVCAGGLDYCGGNCVDTDSDEQNCGACGVQCNTDETCMGGTCVGATIDHISLDCPESALPANASMQCTAMAHYVGGTPAPINVTADALTNWGWDECSAVQGCIDGDVIDHIEDGMVYTVGGGALGDMASIKATYKGLESNPWTITLIQDYLCDVKIVPEDYDFEDFGKDQDFALPYLSNGPGNGLTWNLIPVGIYKNNAACTQGGPYLRELTSGGSWSVVPAGVLSLGNAWWDNRTQAQVVYKSTYPAADATTTVIYNRTAQGMQGDNKAVSDELDVTVVTLTDTNWSLTAQPAALSIPDGKMDGFKVMMNFGGKSLDVTGFGFIHNWDFAIDDTSDPDVVGFDDYYPWWIDHPLAGHLVVAANQDVGAASTTVEWSMFDSQLDGTGNPDNHEEVVSIPVDVIDAVPTSCTIFLNDNPATSQIYPTSHPAVQYQVWAEMSDGGESRNITAENWGEGWQIVYGGTAGALGYVDKYGSAEPGSYHAPATAPTNPNPENGYLRYQYGPDTNDGCQVEIRVRERYLCGVDVTTIPDLDEGQVQTTRRLWNPRAGGVVEDEPLLNNINGVTQQFFAYAEWGYIQGMHCAKIGLNGDGELINGYRTQLPLGQIDEWEYEDNGQHTQPIFGANGINATTGIGTVAASATELDRVADIIVHVGLAPHDCDPVEGCTDSIRVNACGVPFSTPDRQCASSFSEESPPDTENDLTTYAGDVTKRYYAVQQFQGACTFSGGGNYWMDESSESYTTFGSQSTIVTVDNQGALNARAVGDTFISCNWNGGTAEDNMPIHVVGPLVKSFTFAPVGLPTNPRVVTYAPGNPIIPLQAQFFATATLTNGDVVDLADWVAANQGHPLVDGPQLGWGWTDDCDYFDLLAGDGIVSPNGYIDTTPLVADICTLTAACFDCGPQDAHSGYMLYPGIDVFDTDPDEEDIIESSVEARAASVDCARSGIQSPLLACEEGLDPGFTGYAIANGQPSRMDLYYCIAYDNGIYRPVERFADDPNFDVTWTVSGSGVTFADQSHGVINMNGGTGTVYAQLDTCTDTLPIAAGGTNYLESIRLETLWNWNNCGTTADICMPTHHTAQFVVVGEFGTGLDEMDLTTHAGHGAFDWPDVYWTVDTTNELPGFVRSRWADPANTPPYVDQTVSVTTEGETAEADVRVYGAEPTVLNVNVSDSSLDFSDYLGGNLSQITATVTLPGVTGATFNVTNDLIISPSDVTYFRNGVGGPANDGSVMGSYRGRSYNGNWFLIPNDAGNASGLGFDAEYRFWNNAHQWANWIEDDVANISVMP